MSDPTIAAIIENTLPVAINDGTDAIRRKGQRRAAVLMPLVMRDEWHVILTQRPETMPKHAGQISFPGGKVESDETARAAALRETEEEIGLPADVITLIGRLPSFDAVSDYRVTPFIGIVAPDAEIVPDAYEVADVFEVPLSFLMNADNHQPRDVFFDGRDHRMWDMPYTGPDGVYRYIWGMTAMMLRRVSEQAFGTSAKANNCFHQDGGYEAEHQKSVRGDKA